jgi:hypothetical protein
MREMANFSNNEEVAVVAGIVTIGMTATYVSAQTWLPLSFRLTLAGILGLIAFVGGTFWAVFVKANGNPANVPLPPQVQAPVSEVVVVPSAVQASSDAQAASKS